MEYLDVARLGKQRIEATQILEILTGRAILPINLDSIVSFDLRYGPWARHPAILMWKNHVEWLKLYLACAIGEWESRGYQNNIVVPPYDTSLQPRPKWLGYEPFHLSHRSNLMRKAPGLYRKYWDREPIDLPYFWPTHNGFN